jgi:hypothetical protein
MDGMAMGFPEKSSLDSLVGLWNFEGWKRATERTLRWDESL